MERDEASAPAVAAEGVKIVASLAKVEVITVLEGAALGGGSEQKVAEVAGSFK